jgi:quinoprotein relay system zinc metallohydrolase 2
MRVSMIRALFLSLMLPVYTNAAGPLAEALEMVELAPGNFVHYGVHEDRSPRNLGDNANIGFIVGERCVVDTGGSYAVGRALREAIRKRTERPVCYVVITHVHPDHFFGAAAFLDDQPEFLAHENLPRQLAGRARPYLNSLQRDLGDLAQGSEIVQPTRTIATGETLTVDLGGRSVEIKAWEPGHTDDDLTVFDPQTRTLWLGDLLFIEHTPVLDSNITGFLAVMAQLRSIDAAHYVAGHGRSDASWPRPLDSQERYFRTILVETRAAIRRGDTLMDAVHTIGVSEADRWLNFDTYHRRNVTTAWTELEWE